LITDFKTFEAIKLSDAKKYTKIWLDSGMSENLSEIFGKKHRIYLPLDIDKTKIKFDQNLYNEINSKLFEFDFEIVDYVTNLCKKIGTDKNFMKITKVLNKINFENLAILYNKEFETFGVDSEKIVVVSRHPIDIAGMSTDRGWTSCMNLATNSHKFLIDVDIKKGSLIAYLINNDDENIKNPLARIVLKPFIDSNRKSWLLPDKQYGSLSQSFFNTVENWLKKIQGDYPHGLYDIKHGVYTDISPRFLSAPNVQTDGLNWLLFATNSKTKQSLNKLTSLDFSYLSIKELPIELCNLTKVKIINLYDNELAELPKNFGNLKNLERLNLSHNKFTKFPNDLLSLENLKVLKLNGNKFGKIPKEISKLKNLEFLTIFKEDLNEGEFDNLVDYLPNCQVSE
jgi:Leucine-rich repeat (LRR) protein